jgi:hypothetical protein
MKHAQGGLSSELASPVRIDELTSMLRGPLKRNVNFMSLGCLFHIMSWTD